MVSSSKNTQWKNGFVLESQGSQLLQKVTCMISRYHCEMPSNLANLKKQCLYDGFLGVSLWPLPDARSLTSWRRERVMLRESRNLALFSSTLPLQGQSNAANKWSIFEDAFFANFVILSPKCTSAHL